VVTKLTTAPGEGESRHRVGLEQRMAQPVQATSCCNQLL